MRAVAVAIAVVLFTPSPQRPAEPFVPVGVWYGGSAAMPPAVPDHAVKNRDAWRQDLRAIRALGFNSIRTWVDWAAAEPERGTYEFAALDQLLSLADDSGLKVIVQAYTDSVPAWLRPRYPDAGVVVAPGSEPRGFCFDHPGVRADLVAFLSAVAERAARHASFYAIDVWSDPRLASPSWFTGPVEFCYCKYTQARFREWLALNYGSTEAADARARRTFVAVKLREDLEVKADATNGRGDRLVATHAAVPAILRDPGEWRASQDDWWMTAVVDRYGTNIYPKRGAAWTPLHLAATLDAMHSVGRARGWWVAELQAGQASAGAPPVTPADVRLWSWAALSRGAHGISYAAWRGEGGLVSADGELSDRAKAAGEFAGIVTRNPGLFATMRPRSSRIGLLYDPQTYLERGNAPEALRAFHRDMFERNMPADFLHGDHIFVEGAWRYRAVYVPDTQLPKNMVPALEAYVRGGGTIVRSAAEVERARIIPDIRIGGAPGLVEARFLHSGDALLLLAMNHSDAPQEVTMRFAPGTPEAIWQNLEDGTSVSFVMGKEGPFLTHRFAARDVLVLLIRNRLR